MSKNIILCFCLIIVIVSCSKTEDTSNVKQGSGGSQTVDPDLIYDIRMVFIPGGSFRMGTEDFEEDEMPARTVTVDGFEIGVTEVTQAQYTAIMGETPSFFKGNDDFPVERVTWFDAVKFCNKLSDKASLNRCYDENTWICDFSENGFRLPTEAEWEYACRAGTTTEYYTGNTGSDLSKAGWYGDDMGNSNKISHAVAQKTPNAWGLYDMHGNVFEWVNDWYASYDPDSVDNPIGADSATYKVLRGGGWFNGAEYCRSAYRINDRPERTSNFSGFRVVRSAVK